VSPFPTGPSTELPPHTHEPYEQAIRESARHVGNLYLERGELPKAWSFYRLIGEPEPVREALAKSQPGPDMDVYPLIEIAWQNGVLPEKGFDLVLDRHGVCSAITMVGSSDLNPNPKLRDYCVGRLVRALHEQLNERVRGDLQARGLPFPPDMTLPQLVENYPELFADDAYHIDTSHLSSVVQLATHLPPGPENDLARELCEYGRRLSPGLRGGGEAPFDETYDDYLPFLNVVAGTDVDAGLERFRAKAAREAGEGATYAAQVYVNLLVRIGREREALAAARQFLLHEDERNLICPGVAELARRLGDFETMAEVAKERNDPVQFLAGLIAGSGLHPPVRG
ncbi:MAG: hypothetical protein K2P78_13595, partial [Gemmataceae bacterium]|nr:hypothetical protein [Gemmataceae bacterium]